MRPLSQEAENLGGRGCSLRPRFVLFSPPDFARKGVGHDFPIRGSIFIDSAWRMMKVVADYRHRRGIVLSNVNGCCSARVLHPERGDREDSAAARLVLREFSKIFNGSEYLTLRLIRKPVFPSQA